MIAFGLGLLVWSVLEYLMHRRVMHGGARSPLRRFRAQHLLHHRDPAWHPPWWDPAVGAVAVFLTASALGVVIAGKGPGIAYGAGVFTGFTSYEVLHRLVHTDVPLPPPLSWIRMHHLEHHAQPRTRFGITTTLWDRLTGTGR